MSQVEKIGRATSISLDYLSPPEKKELPTKRLPDGTQSRAYHVITTSHRLRKRIRPIEEKREKHHEYRNSSTAVEFRYTCDWCGQGHEAPIHHF
jgi:hypothetical protein